MMDDKVCTVCRSYQGRIFTSKEEIRGLFPYFEYGFPKVHPNCRCWFKPHFVDERRVKEHFGLTDLVWTPLPEKAKYVLFAALLVLMLEDEFKKCVRKERKKGYTKEEAEEICRVRGGHPATPAKDEIERSKQLLEDPRLRIGHSLDKP